MFENTRGRTESKFPTFIFKILRKKERKKSNPLTADRDIVKMDGEFEQTFSFTHLPSKKFSFLEDKNTFTLLMKW